MLVFFRDLVRDSIVRGIEKWSASGDELPRVWNEQLQELGGSAVHRLLRGTTSEAAGGSGGEANIRQWGSCR